MKKNLILITATIFLTLSFKISAQSFDCLDCHENLIEKSVHNEAIGCQDCHSDIKDESHVDKKAKKVNCTECHEDMQSTMTGDIHHRLKVKNSPTCSSCHSTHEIKSPSKVINKAKEFCSKCHKNPVLANKYHSVPVTVNKCVTCHQESNCYSNLQQSVHSKLNCSDCHNYISNNLEKHAKIRDKNKIADCYLCHAEIAAEHRESIHGISLREGIDEAAQCWNCHGSKSIKKVTDPTSPVYPTNISETCLKCHNDKKITQKFDISAISPTSTYENSVHGRSVMKNGKGATCTSCHGVHNIKNRMQPNSTISAFNLPNTCGKCHEEISEEYKKSIHWIKALKGFRMAPICTDCHNEHAITSVSNSQSKRNEIKKLQEKTCIQCHQNPNISGNEVMNYQDSYHGLAVLRGDKDAAMCVDCHNVHKILPASDEESSVNPANVTATCQKCHKGATEVFSKSYSHRTQSEQAATIENWVKTIYVWLIILIIGGMVAHNILIYYREVKHKREKEKKSIRVPRFTKNEVVQHWLLLTSFILLAITGFALKYPKSGWVQLLISLGVTEPIRQIIHKTSAVVMITLSFYHLFYLISTERGREVLRKIFPTISDIRQAVQTVFYYLKLTKEKPEYDKYDYTEKAEYWALIWGTIVMGATGLILWFPTIVGDWAPIWFIKVAELIHFYEAILASLAILVWHWFFVIFRPSEYPMSFVWVDGKMTLENYKHHHRGHFKYVVLEMLKIQHENLELNKASNYTKLFIETLKNQNVDPFEVVKNQMEKDLELRNWIEDRLNLK